MSATFFRVIEASDKAEVLRRTIRAGSEHLRFDIDTSSFADIPRSPFAYWVTEGLMATFRDFVPLSDVAVATVGLQSSDDFRFVACWWEKESDGGYVPFAKGGRYSPYYLDVYLVVNWGEDGREVKAFAEMTPGTKHWSRNIRSANHYFRPGITWSSRTNQLSFRVMPSDCVFTHKGPALLVDADNPQLLLAILAIANSRVFGALVALQVAGTELAQSFEVGLIQQTPVPELSRDGIQELARLADTARSIKYTLDSFEETSHAFVIPPLLADRGSSLAERARLYTQYTADAVSHLASIQAMVDEYCFELYCISAEERVQIERGFSKSTLDTHENGEGEIEHDHTQLRITEGQLVRSQLSWSLGVAFGRFELRLATGHMPVPTELSPFDSLPACSPGVLTGSNGLPIDSAPSGYPISFSVEGVLVDDAGHEWDLVTRSQTVFEQVFDEPEACWHEAAELVGARNQDLRLWFAKDFFTYHIKQYSKSRRKAPIYWQLATPSASYSVWCYYHRFTRDTFFQILNDYVRPKLDHERSKLDRLRGEAGIEPTRSQQKDIEDQEKFVTELTVMSEEVERIAPLWNPNLNDGVIINFAPLWRLVPQNKSWQKECKKCWDKLVAGDYDWAHLAMHLWPERVVPKCLDDRSLAIAHGLEDDFWHEDDDEKWQKRQPPEGSWEPVIKKLIDERSRPGVNAALTSLLEAPAPAGGARRTRQRRATAS